MSYLYRSVENPCECTSWWRPGTESGPKRQVDCWGIPKLERGGHASSYVVMLLSGTGLVRQYELHRPDDVRPPGRQQRLQCRLMIVFQASASHAGPTLFLRDQIRSVRSFSQSTTCLQGSCDFAPDFVTSRALSSTQTLGHLGF